MNQEKTTKREKGRAGIKERGTEKICVTEIEYDGPMKDSA